MSDVEMKAFTWVETYSAIARGVYDFRDNRSRLFEVFSSVFDGTHDVSFPANGGEECSAIDPFSFFSSFNRGILLWRRNEIVRLVLEGLGINDVPVPSDYEGLPVVNNFRSWFFASEKDRGPRDVDNLWELFCSAVELASSFEDRAHRARFVAAFDVVREQPLIKWNITIALYWMLPNSFMTLDGRSRAYLADAFGIKINGSSVPTGDEYLALIDRLRELTDKPFYQLSSDAYQWKPAPKTPRGWHPKLTEYNPGIDVDAWNDLLDDPEVFNCSARTLMLRLMDIGGEATCTQLAQKYGESMNYYLGAASGFAQRVAKRTGCPLYDGKYWPIPFYGRKAQKNEAGEWFWRLRPELAEALEDCNLSDVSLYADGSEAPEAVDASHSAEDHGVGTRRYWWLTANKKIWSFSEIAVGEEQSYTIRNDKGNPRRIFKNFLDARVGDVVVGYETTPVKRVVALCEISHEQDGQRLYFKKIRDLTEQVTLAQIKEDPLLSECEFCRNPNGSFFRLSAEEYERLEELMGAEDEDLPLAREFDPYTDTMFLDDVFLDAADLATMKALLLRKKNLILQGAPGTGKTYAAKRLAYAMMSEKNDSRIQSVQFHQSTTYEEFVYGYRPNGDGGFEAQPGLFTRFCRKAADDADNSYFLIIDEINRANISKVFGELLVLIEADHRDDSVELGIDGQHLSVPKNLYIIGMMNTADRGLALIDYALRRRFAFFDMRPALDSPQFLKMLERAHNEKLEALVARVRDLNREIANDPALGPGFCVGHSYFCVDESVSDNDVVSIARYEIKPLVTEYWFDDPDKAGRILSKIEEAIAG